MVLGETGRECRLDFFKTAANHGWRNIHLVGMQRRESALAAPEVKDAGLVKEGQQKLLVIACQSNDGRWPFAGCESFDHRFRIGTAIDVITQEDGQGMIERPSLHVGLNALGHLPEQIVTTVDIPDAVD